MDISPGSGGDLVDGAEDKIPPLKGTIWMMEDAVLFEPALCCITNLSFKGDANSPSQEDPLHSADSPGFGPACEMAFKSIPLHIVTHSRTVVFINIRDIFPIYPIDRMNWNLKLSGGRILRLSLPRGVGPGTFMTYDEKSKSLFSGDIFGAIPINGLERFLCRNA